MSDILNPIFARYDPDYIARLRPYKKHRERKKLIAGFLRQCRQGGLSRIDSNRDKHMVKNNINYYYFSIGAYGLVGAVLYKLFFSGVYEFKDFYFDVNKSVPFPIRLGITLGITYYLFESNFKTFIYTPELYKIAVNCIKDDKNGKVNSD